MTRRDVRWLVKTAIEEIAKRLEAGEAAKITSFGSLNLRDKGEWSRNPRTLAAMPLAPRRVVSFRTSQVLKKRINKRLSGRAGGG